MPIINVHVSGKPDQALSRKIAEAVTEITRDVLRKDPTVTAVAVHYADPEHWFAGGKSLAEQKTGSFWLDIKVVDGTNTKHELSRYLVSIFAKMENLLGAVHHESYTFVHEVPASAYGYGGKTQEYRFISSQIGS